MSEHSTALAVSRPTEARCPEMFYDKIVLWRDVRTGDLVLLGGTLVVAERVNVYTDTSNWTGEQWLRVDVDYHDDEGHRFSREARGDSLTAIRRPKAERQ